MSNLSVDVCRVSHVVSKLFSLGIDHVRPLTFLSVQYSHLHRTKATFRASSHEFSSVQFTSVQLFDIIQQNTTFYDECYILRYRKILNI